MGTKVEYSINLLLATSVDSNNSTSCVTVKKGHRIGTNIFNLLQFPMEKRFLDRNIVESIKKTMQMHENIFKHQVEELHRVYSVQKKLMEELKRESNREKKAMDMINHHHHHHHHHQAQSSRERSSGSCCEEQPQSETKRGRRGFDLEIMGAEELLEGTSNNMGEDGFHEAEMEEVDLTLSIGGGSSKFKKKKKKVECCKVDLRVVGECSDPTTPMSSSSVTFEQERKEPQYWLSQGLKLK